MATQAKTRNWAFILYPDSAPDNWAEILDDMHVKALVSPMHDRDVFTDTGELKKPHRHVLVAYDGPVTEKVATERLSVFCGTRPEAVASLSSYARYLCHMDNPEKAAYEAADVMQFGGIDFFEVIQTNCDRLTAIAEMQEFCDDNDVVSFAELNRYARNNRRDWFMYLCNSATVVMRDYLKARSWEKLNSDRTVR